MNRPCLLVVQLQRWVCQVLAMWNKVGLCLRVLSPKNAWTSQSLPAGVSVLLSLFNVVVGVSREILWYRHSRLKVKSIASWRTDYSVHYWSVGFRLLFGECWQSWTSHGSAVHGAQSLHPAASFSIGEAGYQTPMRGRRALKTPKWRHCPLKPSFSTSTQLERLAYSLCCNPYSVECS